MPEGVPSVDSVAASLSSYCLSPPSLATSLPPSLPATKGEERVVEQLTIECRVCFEDESVINTCYLSCCGQLICLPCYHLWLFKEEGKRGTCPNCRAPHTTHVERVSLLRRHIAAGKAWAHYELALYYNEGQGGLRQSYEKSFHHYLLADQGGEIMALYNLGLCYEQGKGVSKSFTKAIEYYSRGSSLGIDHCSYNIGVVYSKEGPHQDYGKAVHYMKLAMHQRSELAFFELGGWYMEGECGLPVDKAKGIELTTKAADDELQGAQYNLGYYYLNGDGVERSIPLAIKYLMQSLEELQEKDRKYNVNLLYPLKRHLSMYNLGQCYLEDGPDHSLVDAYYWFKNYLLTQPASSKGDAKEKYAEEKIDELDKVLPYQCSHCMEKKETGLPQWSCTGCGVAAFCSKECQRAEWDSHKEVCVKMKEVIAKAKSVRDEQERVRQIERDRQAREEAMRKEAIEKVERERAEEVARQKAYDELMAEEPVVTKSESKKGKKK